MQLEDGDRLLLCSDGLTDLVDDEAITRILLETSRSSDACERLVQQALDSGGRDNMTVIVAAYRLPEEPARTTGSSGERRRLRRADEARDRCRGRAAGGMIAMLSSH